MKKQEVVADDDEDLNYGCDCSNTLYHGIQCETKNE